MRRNATKVAAAVLSLAVTMTSINLPTTAAAATKKVKLNKTKATLRVGKTTTLKVTKGGKKVKATFTSNKKKIATVGKKTGKVKAKKKGTCTITAKYAGKKYKCKITVKKKVTSTATTKPTAAPTTAPTATPAPTTAPTQTPAPTTAPTQTPAALTIASASAIAADTIKVNLSAPLPSDATLKLAKKGSTGTVTVKTELDAERKVATLKADANYATGTYVVTLTSGGKDVASVEVAIEAQRVDKIEILNKNKKALTSTDRKRLYVYYDVKDQYGNSMKERATINWSSSTGRIDRNDKAKGCLILIKATTDATQEQFKYGDPVHILGVDVNRGVTCQENLTVDMTRALASVKFRGFIDTKADTKEDNIKAELPTDFAKGRYLLLYDALDQEEQLMDADDYVSTSSSTTSRAIFNVNQPTLIKSTLNKGGTYTVTDKNNNAKTYCSVEVNPGMYVDRGGDVTFTAISNTTGTRTEQNYVIGKGQLLKSLVLSDPGNLADGDEDKEIAYIATAVDKDGNEISGVTNYETIVRSTNKLKLNASEGKIEVYQKEDGTAGIKWSDSKITANNKKQSRAKYFGTSNTSAYDNLDRNINLSTIVVNGENSHTTLRVSDARRPVSVESVKLNGDNNNMITEKNKATINLFGTTDDTQDVIYKDQYGVKLDKEIAEAFFRWTNRRGKGFDGKQYGVYVDYSSAVDSKNAGAIGNNNSDYIYATAESDGEHIYDDWSYNDDTKVARQGHNVYIAYDGVNGDDDDIDKNSNQTQLKLETNHGYQSDAYTRNIKYSVVRCDETTTSVNSNWNHNYDGSGTGNTGNSGTGNESGDTAGRVSKNWSIVESEKNITYTIVPVSKLSDLKFKDIKKVRIETDQSQYENGQAMNNSNVPGSNGNSNWNSANTWSNTTVAAIGANNNRVTPEIQSPTKREVSITGYYNGNLITIPDNYYDIYAQKNSYQTFILDRDVDDNNKLKIDSLNSAATSSAITYGNLYNFNDAKNLRRDAKKELLVSVYQHTVDNNGRVDDMASNMSKKDYLAGNIKTDIQITDARRSFGKIAFKDDKTALNLKAKNTKLDFATEYNVSNHKLQDYTIEVFDDCNDKLSGDKKDNEEYSLRFTVENYSENSATVTDHKANDNKYTHLPKSFAIKQNGTNSTTIEGAEIGDMFNLTVSVVNSNASIKVPVTMFADKLAHMSYDANSDYQTSAEFDEGMNDDNNENDLRDTLGYDR